MRVISRTSKWAIWARRFANFALPLSVLPVWMHRNQLLGSETFQIILVLAVLLAILAILSGLAAYVRVWQTGDHGWGRATFGIIVGLICLSPIIYGAIQGARYPLINDVSTDLARPLELVVKPSPGLTVSAELKAQIAEAFPDVFTRQYLLTPTQVFPIIEELVLAKEWDVRVRRQPGIGGRQGQLNAMAMTLMGWRDEIVLRVVQTSTGSQVDMRSTSLNGVGDLGTNGKRIEGFLRELDDLVVLKIEENQ